MLQEVEPKETGTRRSGFAALLDRNCCKMPHHPPAAPRILNRTYFHLERRCGFFALWRMLLNPNQAGQHAKCYVCITFVYATAAARSASNLTFSHH